MADDAPRKYRFGLRRFPIIPGGHAEVTSVTSKGLFGHGQTGILLVTRPGAKPATMRLTNRSYVQTFTRRAAEYNALCGGDGSPL